MYVGRVWLKYADREVWQLTPRQFKSQLDVHEDITRQMHGGKQADAAPMGFIDQIPGW